MCASPGPNYTSQNTEVVFSILSENPFPEIPTDQQEDVYTSFPDSPTYEISDSPVHLSRRNTFEDSTLLSAESSWPGLWPITDAWPDDVETSCESRSRPWIGDDMNGFDIHLDDFEPFPHSLFDGQGHAELVELNEQQLEVAEESNLMTNSSRLARESSWSSFAIEASCSTFETSSTPGSIRSAQSSDLLAQSAGVPRSAKCRIEPIRHHRSSVQETDNLPKCALCDRRFTYRKDVVRHKLTAHSKVLEWFCPVQTCEYSTRGFSRKDKTVEHIRKHHSTFNVILGPIFKPGEII